MQVGADDPAVRDAVDRASPPKVGVVYPAKVEGTRIVHLCRSEDADAGPGVLRAICPGGAGISRPLLPVEDDETWIWCPACKAWGLAAGIKLPRSR